MRIETLRQQKTEIEQQGNINSLEYIRCLANIVYYTTDKNRPDYTNIKCFFLAGLEKAYGCVSNEVMNEIDTALDLMFKGDFKGFCLLSAIIASLEKCKEDKDE